MNRNASATAAGGPVRSAAAVDWSATAHSAETLFTGEKVRS